jgi:hypothetical protein
MNWRFPLWTAGIGIAICAASVAFIQLELRFNFFHNPTSTEVQSMGQYRAPLAERMIYDAIPVLTPGTILLVGFKDTPHGWDLVLYLGIWAVAAVINAMIYGAIGLLLAQIVGAMRRKASHPA